MNIEIPSHLARNLRTHYGSEVDEWLKTIPSLLQRLEKGWDFKPQACLLGGVASILLRGKINDDKVALLKIPFDQQLVLWEAVALEHWQGRGCSPTLLALDKKALLLEYIEGEPITGEVLVSTEKIIELLTCLHKEPQPKNIALPNLHSIWQERQALLQERITLRAQDQFKDEFEYASRLSASLEASATKKILLHGDLHLGNVLQDSTGKLHAIDPKPRHGDPGWDLAYISLSAGTASQRVALLADLAKAYNYPLERALQWQWLLALDDVISKWWRNEGQLIDLKQYG